MVVEGGVRLSGLNLRKNSAGVETGPLICRLLSAAPAGAMDQGQASRIV